MSSDGTLARVTYLPGVTPPAEAPHHEPGADAGHTPGSSPVHTALSDDEQARRAENVSMHALTRRGMSRWELGQVLLGRELEPHIVEAELERLERVGLIDDAALAETVVRTQHERKGLGKAALVAVLRRRNIEQNVIDEALVQVSAEDEAARAESLAERRAAQLTGLDHDTAVRRLSGYLQRKGYSSETVRAAVIAALPRHPSGVRFR